MSKKGRGDLRAPFSHFARRGKGNSLNEFIEAIDDLKFKLSDNDAKGIFSVMDLDGDGVVKYNEFAILSGS